MNRLTGEITAEAAKVAAAVPANNSSAVNAAAAAKQAANALARLEVAIKARKALEVKGAPANAGLGAIAAKARANAQKAKNIAAARKANENRAAREAKEAAEKANREAKEAAKAEAARVKAEAAARAANEKAKREQTAAAEKAARNAEAARVKAAANAEKAAANAEKAKAVAHQRQIREFVEKLWKLTKGNGIGERWRPRITEESFLKREISKFNPGFTAAQRNEIIGNINVAVTKGAVGRKLGGVFGSNDNLAERKARAKKLVNIVFPPTTRVSFAPGVAAGAPPTPTAGRPTRSSQENRNAAAAAAANLERIQRNEGIARAKEALAKARTEVVNALARGQRDEAQRIINEINKKYDSANRHNKPFISENIRQMRNLLAAPQSTGGTARSQALQKQARLTKIANNLTDVFVTGSGNVANPNSYKTIDKNLLQGLTKNEIVNHLKTVQGFRPGNTRGFTNQNLQKMAEYFTGP